MATAILRVRAGKHFWTDVLVGYGVGASIGLAVPLMHKIEFQRFK
jgi:membrane-associated phospholipid phosphatase